MKIKLYYKNHMLKIEISKMDFQMGIEGACKISLFCFFTVHNRGATLRADSVL